MVKRVKDTEERASAWSTRPGARSGLIWSGLGQTVVLYAVIYSAVSPVLPWPASCMMRGAKLAAPHECSCPTRHAPTCPCTTREREMPTRARSTPGHFGPSLWSLWGLLQFASPSASATAAINWLPIAVYQGEIEKTLQTARFWCVTAGSNAPMHNANHPSPLSHHIPPSPSALISRQL